MRLIHWLSNIKSNLNESNHISAIVGTRLSIDLKGNEYDSQKARQHSVHPTGGSLRVFRHFAWLEVGSVKMALSRPTHQRVTHTVGQLRCKI